ELECLCPAVLAAPKDDRPRVAQPDVAEWFDDHLGEGAEPSSRLGGAFVSGDQPDFLAPAPGVHGLGKGRDLALGGLEIAQPQLGIAWKADPDRLVRRPF